MLQPVQICDLLKGKVNIFTYIQCFIIVLHIIHLASETSIVRNRFRTFRKKGPKKFGYSAALSHNHNTCIMW